VGQNTRLAVSRVWSSLSFGECSGFFRSNFVFYLSLSVTVVSFSRYFHLTRDFVVIGLPPENRQFWAPCFRGGTPNFGRLFSNWFTSEHVAESVASHGGARKRKNRGKLCIRMSGHNSWYCYCCCCCCCIASTKSCSTSLSV